jgi:hypothetical protein
MMEMLENWESCPDENVGWCLLCDGPIRSEKDQIPNRVTFCTLFSLLSRRRLQYDLEVAQPLAMVIFVTDARSCGKGLKTE